MPSDQPSTPVQAGLYTLNEASDLTGLSVDALRQRIKRRKLNAVRGNDGLVRVRLDQAAVDALKGARPSSQPPSQPPSRPDDSDRVVSALEAHLETLREQLAKAEAERLAVQQRLDQAHQAAADERKAWADERRQLIDHVDELAGRIAILTTKPRAPWWRRILGDV